MAVYSTMTFTRGVTTITLPMPLRGALRREVRQVQASAVAADGTAFVDDKGVTLYYVRFLLRMTLAQASAFVGFYRDTTVGALNTFTWVDHRGKGWANCRFSDEQRTELTTTAGGLYEIEVILKTAVAFP